MDVHENARTTVHSRMLMVERLRSGWSVAQVAAAQGVDPRSGWLFLAVLIDLFSRGVVGWATGERQTLEHTLAAHRMAIEQRKPRPGLVHHTDQGAIYASPVYREVLKRRGYAPA